MASELEQAELEVRAAHEQLREAIRRADRATHARARARALEDADLEAAEAAANDIAFMDSAHLVDYVAGSLYVDLSGEADFLAVLITDGAASRHRSVGLLRLVTQHLEIH